MPWYIRNGWLGITHQVTYCTVTRRGLLHSTSISVYNERNLWFLLILPNETNGYHFIKKCTLNNKIQLFNNSWLFCADNDVRISKEINKSNMHKWTQKRFCIIQKMQKVCVTHESVKLLHKNKTFMQTDSNPNLTSSVHQKPCIFKKRNDFKIDSKINRSIKLHQ